MLDRRSAPPASGTVRDDTILPMTRAVAAAVIPFLVAAFVIIYLRSSDTAQRFAWEIKSPITAAVMGAGYIGGAYFFARVLMERRWHRVASGFPATGAFAAAMLVATILHWDTFDPAHLPFLVWLALYAVTPFLLPLVWWLNRRRDPGEPDPGDTTLPEVVGRFIFILGLLLLAEAVILFLLPAAAADRWPWPLTPLTARVLAAWQVLLAVGAMTLAGERRWSGWRIPLQAILFWQALMLVAFVLRRDGFNAPGLLNWFVLYTTAGVIAAASLYAVMERRYRAGQ